jgi:putative ABC transport system ATP-binding protein
MAQLSQVSEQVQPMVHLNNIGKVYRTDRIETVALSGINLTVRNGEFISIMGPSGSGKSTLLNVVGLLDEPTSGGLSIGGKKMASYSDRNLARMRNEEIGFIFQSFHLINDLRVVDNIEIPLLYRRNISGSERRKMALHALDRVDLHARVHHFPSELSSGQQQRVAIARAIVGNPRLVLADEPTGNLDSQMGDEIMEVLRGLNRDGGTTVIMVTHDQRQADKTQRIFRLFDGRQIN